jgi:hypothetical protein
MILDPLTLPGFIELRNGHFCRDVRRTGHGPEHASLGGQKGLCGLNERVF